MALVNIIRGKSGSELVPFTTLVEAIDPEVWYRFNEASGDIINIGNDIVTDLDLVFGEGEIGVRQSVTLTDVIGSLSSNRSRAILSAAGNGIQDINAGSPATTGTFVLVWAGPRKGLGWLWENFDGFDVHGIGMRMDSAAVTFHMQNGVTATNEYSQRYNGNFQDGLPHMFAMAQQATGATGSVKNWIDGVDAGAPDTETKGAGISFDYWLPDQPAASRVVVGGRGNPRENEASGYYQELFYIDGVVLSDAQILELWNSVSQLATFNRDMRVAIEAISTPLYYWIMNESGDPSVGDDFPLNYGSEDFEVDTIQGPPVYAEAGHSAHDSANLFEPTSQVLPEGFYNIIDANKPRMASGYIHFIFQQPVTIIDPATIIGYSDSSPVTNDLGRVVLGSNNTLDVAFQANEATTPDRITYRLNLANEGVIDMTNGQQYQVIALQNGVDEPLTWYIGNRNEQRVYAFDHADNDIFISGAATKDGTDWFADWVTDGYINFALGLVPTGPTTRIDGASCHLSHVVIDDHQITAQEAADLYETWINGLLAIPFGNMIVGSGVGVTGYEGAIGSGFGSIDDDQPDPPGGGTTLQFLGQFSNLTWIIAFSTAQVNQNAWTTLTLDNGFDTPLVLTSAAASYDAFVFTTPITSRWVFTATADILSKLADGTEFSAVFT